MSDCIVLCWWNEKHTSICPPKGMTWSLVIANMEGSCFSWRLVFEGRKKKNADEEAAWLQETIPQNTRNSTKWSVKIFKEWQSSRSNKVAANESLGFVREGGRSSGFICWHRAKVSSVFKPLLNDEVRGNWKSFRWSVLSPDLQHGLWGWSEHVSEWWPKVNVRNGFQQNVPAVLQHQWFGCLGFLFSDPNFTGVHSFLCNLLGELLKVLTL